MDQPLERYVLLFDAGRGFRLDLGLPFIQLGLPFIQLGFQYS